MAFLNARGVANKMGVFFKTSASLQALSKITHIVFDKTGTLSDGLKVSHIKVAQSLQENEFLAIEEKIVAVLKTVFDPEIPVNIYDLGLIYRIENNDGNIDIDMTLTAPNCPAADFMAEDVRLKVAGIEGVKTVNVNIVFEPEWTQDRMTDEAKLELGLL